MHVVFEAMSRRSGPVTDPDVLFHFRLRLYTLQHQAVPVASVGNAALRSDPQQVVQASSVWRARCTSWPICTTSSSAES